MKISELLDKPEKWTQRCFAQDADGTTTMPSSPLAVCWCFVGAARRCYGDFPAAAFKEIMNKMGQDLGSITDWNDSPERKYEDIINFAKQLDI